MDQTVLVAVVTGVLTAGTALMASWLTGRATVTAARVNTESAAENQRRERTRELRRTAYVDLLAYATQMRWLVMGLTRRAAAGDSTALVELRDRRTDAGYELSRRRYVVYLEGPRSIQEPAQRLRISFDRLADDVETAFGLDPDQIEAAVKDSIDLVGQRIDEFLAATGIVLDANTAVDDGI